MNEPAHLAAQLELLEVPARLAGEPLRDLHAGNGAVSATLLGQPLRAENGRLTRRYPDGTWAAFEASDWPNLRLSPPVPHEPSGLPLTPPARAALRRLNLLRRLSPPASDWPDRLVDSLYVSTCALFGAWTTYALSVMLGDRITPLLTVILTNGRTAFIVAAALLLLLNAAPLLLLPLRAAQERCAERVLNTAPRPGRPS